MSFRFPSSRAVGAQRLDQSLAGGEFAGENVLIRLVGAVYVTGPADDRLEPSGLVKPGLRAVADGGERYLAGQGVQQSCKWSVWRQRHRRIGAHRCPLDTKAIGCKSLGLRLDGRKQACRVDARYGARLQVQGAGVGDDVDLMSAR